MDNAIRVYNSLLTDRLERLARLTGLSNPNSNKPLLAWLKGQGYPYDDVQKGHIKRALEFFETAPDTWSPEKKAAYQSNDRLKKALELRLEAAKSSPKKYITLRRYLDPVDGVIRNVFQFAGAGRTWRWCLAEGSLVLVMSRGGVIEELPIECVTRDHFVCAGWFWAWLFRL